MEVCHSALTCLRLVEHLAVIVKNSNILVGQLDCQQWHLAAVQLCLIYVTLDQPAASGRESSSACSSGCERRIYNVLIRLILGAPRKW